MNALSPLLNSDNTGARFFAAINENRLAVGGALFIGATLWYVLTSDNNNIKRVRGWPVIGHWDFFTK